MEPALLLAVAALLTLGLHILVDLSFGAVVAIGRADVRWSPAIRTAIVGCMAGLLLLTALRMPVAASTPPPAVRLSEMVSDPSESIRNRVGKPALAEEDSSNSYTVERGDSLWRIAKSVLESRDLSASGPDVAEFWRTIYRANSTLIGSDPNLIYPGQVLEIPEG
ncbi:MAG: LysM peptidoglycan-binding domain-containing protein [Acidimicrobiia bacterium]